MTESLATEPNARPIADADDTLRLKCDQCGGGLVLKRRHLGIKGQCVHCHVPLMAVEEDGVVRVVSEKPVMAPAPVEELPAAPEPAPVDAVQVAEVTESAPSLEPAPLAGPSEADPILPWSVPGPIDSVEEASADIPATEFGFGSVTAPDASEPVLPWGLAALSEPASEVIAPTAQPELESPVESVGSSTMLPWGTPAPVESPAPAPAGPSVPGLQPPLPTRDGDNLFGGKPEGFSDAEPAPAAASPSSPFGDTQSGFSMSFPSMFGSEDAGSAVASAWGTNVPKEGHASISPFGTGTAGEGFAESLFREKVEKENASHHAVGIPAFATEPGNGGPFAQETPKRDSEEKVILDGDGRPMRPMTKEEEEEFAKNFFKYDNARSTPRWVKRLRKTAMRFLIFFCILGAGGGGVAAFTPKEQLQEWKKKTIEWLEPGMAILDYLPEKWRPKWLPQSKFGIDAGVDENGQPKKKMNAFEGLEKLKGDIGNMRGAADAELEGLKQF